MEAIGNRTMRAMCKLSMDELIERERALVDQTQARELREVALQTFLDAKKAEQKVYEADILHTANECFRLARIIRSGEEARDVKVTDYIDGPGVVSVREDTGEQIGFRPATPDELQKPLSFGGGGES